MSFEIHTGDCRDVMAAMEPNSVDTIITDPPYGLEFMGKDWDGGVPGVHFWQLALRVAKPGAMLLAFGGTRTWHRLACAIEDAGWEIRDTLMWLYGSGFPKSHNIGKAIDKAAGAEREVLGDSPNWRPAKTHGGAGFDKLGNGPATISITAPATPDAQLWDGWGTALKPAWEPIILAMKPCDGTFAHNAETWGVAGLNVDGGRIATEDCLNGGTFGGIFGNGKPTIDKPIGTGRWPANLLLDEEAAAMLDEQSGVSKSNPYRANKGGVLNTGASYGQGVRKSDWHGPADTGGASRFFYVAKASRREREAGLEGLPAHDGDECYGDGLGNGPDRIVRTNHHPTVKPIALMRYLVRLTATPTGGVVLDSFMGSGSTGCACALEGRDFIGIEQDAEYCEIARVRIAYWETQCEPATQATLL